MIDRLQKQAYLSRIEISSSLEDRDRQRALRTLERLGFLVEARRVDTYHGRVRRAGELEWSVDPVFANGGNATQHHNVHQRPVLYTASREIATEFATSRLDDLVFQATIEHCKQLIQADLPAHRQDIEAKNLYASMPSQQRKALEESLKAQFIPEIHQITSRDPRSYIMQAYFKPENLSQTDMAAFVHAIHTILPGITEGAPPPFTHIQETKSILAALNTRDANYISEQELTDIAEKTHTPIALVRRLVGAHNARKLLSENPRKILFAYLENGAEQTSISMDEAGSKLNIPIHFEYVSRFFVVNHLIGIQHNVRSSTLNKIFPIVAYVDLDKTKTTLQIEKEQQKIHDRMRGLADAFPSLPDWKQLSLRNPLLHVLEQHHIDPAVFIDSAKAYPFLDSLFKQDAGNWERFTIGEHTETVLRNFEENFADRIPSGYLMPMRLAILVHDLGKGEAARNQDKLNQDAYNEKKARFVLRHFRIPDNLSELIIALITKGTKLAFRHQMNPSDLPAYRVFEVYAHTVMRDFFGSSSTLLEQRLAFMEMCKILQLCDGGAYTDMAITRVAGVGHFRNPPSFNDSFDHKRTGLDGRGIRYMQMLRSALNP